ncbi:MAG: nucleoside 2-deoxyribosyltransferase [Anaerolineae bacterium]|nr:nucleoside 2-deoxyribosyltransferase [Anaerolineae bacterium]
MTLKLYIAGPLFTPYHRAFHARNAARLRSEGFICLVPHERSITRAFEWDTGTPTTPIDIFDMDYDMVAECDAIVALLDDPDVSSGLACEIGLFWSMKQFDPRKKGVLGLLTDDRAPRRADVGVPAVNAFTLGCILDIGSVYSTLDQVIAHLHAWKDGREIPVGEINL